MQTNELEIKTALDFLKSPQKIVDSISFTIDDKAEILEVEKALSALNETDLSKFLPVLVTNFCASNEKYVGIYNTLKQENIKQLQNQKRLIDAETLTTYLQVIRDNWGAIAIIALFLRSLGQNKFTIELSSVIPSLAELFGKKKLTSDDSKTEK